MYLGYLIVIAVFIFFFVINPVHNGYFILIVVAIFFVIYLFHQTIKKSEEKQKQRRREEQYKIDREKNREEYEKNIEEYENKEKEIMKETKSEQRRPGDWSMRRSYVMRRDGNKCAFCGGTTSLQVHHIDPISEGHDHSENNLITLCIYCHSEQEGMGHKGLDARIIGKESKNQRYIKRKSRKEYTCDSCKATIYKGEFSYVKENDLENGRWVNNKRRICEKCLLK